MVAVPNKLEQASPGNLLGNYLLLVWAAPSPTTNPYVQQSTKVGSCSVYFKIITNENTHDALYVVPVPSNNLHQCHMVWRYYIYSIVLLDGSMNKNSTNDEDGAHGGGICNILCRCLFIVSSSFYLIHGCRHFFRCVLNTVGSAS